MVAKGDCAYIGLDLDCTALSRTNTTGTRRRRRQELVELSDNDNILHTSRTAKEERKDGARRRGKDNALPLPPLCRMRPRNTDLPGMSLWRHLLSRPSVMRPMRPYGLHSESFSSAQSCKNKRRSHSGRSHRRSALLRTDMLPLLEILDQEEKSTARSMGN